MILDDFSLLIGIDLGTTNTLAGVPGKGIVFEEPTLVARQKKKLGKPGRILAFGRKAKQMVGKEPQQVEVIEPLVDGAIADFDATIEFLKYLVTMVSELPSRFPRFLKPRAVIGVPSGITEVEKRAVKSAGLAAGMGKVFLVEEPMATAVGAGLNIEKAAGNLLIDIGGGTSEIALISLGGIVLNRCLRIAGKEMDEAIVSFLRLKYGILIGLPTAERVKIKIGSVLPQDGKKKRMVIRGRDLETGLPKSIEIGEEETREAISPIIREIVGYVNELLEETPPELTADVSRRGIVLSGGCCQLAGMEELVSQTVKMPAWTAKNPLFSVCLGCINLLKNKKLLKEVMVTGGMK